MLSKDYSRAKGPSDRVIDRRAHRFAVALALSPGQSLRHRSPASAVSIFDACEPPGCSRRAEQAPVAVAPVGILAKLARAVLRHRAVLQRQARRFTQQYALSHGVRRCLAAHQIRRERDCPVIARGTGTFGCRDGRAFLGGWFARSLAKQLFEYFDHDVVSVITFAALFVDSATHGQPAQGRIASMRAMPQTIAR